MHRLTSFLLLLATSPLVLLAGCGAPQTQLPAADAGPAAPASTSPQTRIGTIDVGKIYNLTGLQNQRNAKLRELNQKRVKLEQERNDAMQKKIAEFGGDTEKLSDEQKQELQKMQAEWLAARRDNTIEAQQVMQETDQFLNNLYNQQTAEPIRKVAEARGLDMVLVLQRNLFAYINPEVDITDEVLSHLNLPTPPAEGPGEISELLQQSGQGAGAGAAPQEPAGEPAPAEPDPSQPEPSQAAPSPPDQEEAADESEAAAESEAEEK